MQIQPTSRLVLREGITTSKSIKNGRVLKFPNLAAILLAVAFTGDRMTDSQDPIRPIAQEAAATLKIPGYVDFLAADEAAVWVTNRGR